MNGDRFLTYLEFLQKFNVRINFVDFISIICAVKQNTSQNRMLNATNKTIPYQPALNFIMNTTKGASAIYHSILEPDVKNKGFSEMATDHKYHLKPMEKQFQNTKKKYT